MTPGRRQLLAVLTRTEVRYVAARCRVTCSAVYAWTAGVRRPAPRSRAVLEASYGISTSAWSRTSR